MPPFAVEVHPQAADEAEAAFAASLIAQSSSSLIDLKSVLLTSAAPGAICFADSLSSSSIGCPTGMSRSSPLLTLGADRGTGLDAEIAVQSNPLTNLLGGVGAVKDWPQPADKQIARNLRHRHVRLKVLLGLVSVVHIFECSLQRFSSSQAVS